MKNNILAQIIKIDIFRSNLAKNTIANDLNITSFFMRKENWNRHMIKGVE